MSYYIIIYNFTDIFKNKKIISKNQKMTYLKKFVTILLAVSLVMETKAQNEMPNNFAKAFSQIKNRIDQTEIFYKSQINGLHPILTSNIYFEDLILKVLLTFDCN